MLIRSAQQVAQGVTVLGRQIKLPAGFEHANNIRKQPLLRSAGRLRQIAGGTPLEDQIERHRVEMGARVRQSAIVTAAGEVHVRTTRLPAPFQGELRLAGHDFQGADKTSARRQRGGELAQPGPISSTTLFLFNDNKSRNSPRDASVT